MSLQTTHAPLGTLLGGAQKESVRRAGSQMLGYPLGMKVVGVVGLLFFGGMQVAAIVSLPPAEAWFYGWVSSPFVLLNLALLAESFVTRIRFDDSFIYTRSPWRMPRRIPWASVEGCDYGEYNQWYRIHAGPCGIVRVSVLMWGVGEFLQRLPCPHPAYPPVDSLGKSVCGLGNGSENHLALSAPGFPVPVRLRATKVIAVLFFCVACGSLFFWRFAQLPDRADYRQVRGRITHSVVHREGLKRTLELRLDTSSTLLKLASDNAGQFPWTSFQEHPPVGRMAVVLVANEDWADPSKPWLAEEPFIWIRALEINQKPLLAFDLYVAQERRAHALLPWGALFFVGFSGWTWWTAKRHLKKLADAAASKPEATAHT